jgi:hypothetical protein
VLDLDAPAAGRYATLLLADLGADVVKIEDPRGGDGMRSLPTARRRNYFELLNRNKRSVTLDLRSPSGVAVLDALCAHATSSSTASGRRRRGGSASTRRRSRRGIRAWSARRSAVSARRARTPSAPRTTSTIRRSRAACARRSCPGRWSATSAPRRRRPSASSPRWLLRDRTAQRQRRRCVDSGCGDGSGRCFRQPASSRNACYAVYETSDGPWLALGAPRAQILEGGSASGLAGRIWWRSSMRTGDERTWVESEVRRVMLGLTRDEWLARFADADVCLTPIYTRRRLTRIRT